MTPPDGLPADTAVVMPAAGAGVRLGGDGPKALRLLAGEPLLAHAARRLFATASVGYVLVAAPPGAERAVEALLTEVRDDQVRRRAAGAAAPPPAVQVVSGGAERQQSVALALAALPAAFDIVLVHDAARALAPPELVDAVAAEVRSGGDAVIPVLPVTDTITRVDAHGASLGHLDRSSLRAVQTPQGFRRAVLVEAHAAAAEVTATDDAGLVARLGVPVHTVAGSEQALKITTPADLIHAEAMLAASTKVH